MIAELRLQQPSRLSRKFIQTFWPGGVQARLPVLAYHQILAKPDPYRPDAITVAEFEQQMAVLAKHYQVWPLSLAWQKLQAGELPAGSLAITFDDGYADNAELALPILKKWNLTATIFVSSDFVESGELMWNDQLIEACRLHPADPLDLHDHGLKQLPMHDMHSRLQSMHSLLQHAKYMDAAPRQGLIEAILAQSGKHLGDLPTGLMMSVEQLQSMASAGMEIGGHTCSHPILSQLDADAAQAEIQQGKHVLEQLIDRRLSAFAYPNGHLGRDYNHSHTQMVRQAGFEVACTSNWGVTTSRSDPYQLERCTPWDKSPTLFAMRLLYSCAGSLLRDTHNPSQNHPVGAR